MPNHLPRAFVFGLLSAGMFLLVMTLGLGFFFLFLPILPLLCEGMGKDPRIALWGAGFATLVIAVVGGAAAGVLFFALIGLPSWTISRQALLSQGQGESRSWYPVGLIITHLTLYGCALLALASLLYVGEPGGIEALVGQNIRETLSSQPEEYAQAVNLLADQLSFLIFSVTLWLWAAMLYAHMWFASRLLAKKGTLIRPDVAVRPFIMPNWMFSLMGICALASLIGGDTTRFLGNTTLIALLLPYFFLGASVMHALSRHWPNRRFFLFFVYLFIFAQLWPAFFLSAFGLWCHIKGLPAGAASSKN
jgi:hypothetical protein